MEKKDATGARIWWRRFTQYTKMVYDLDLGEMTTDLEVKPECRDTLDGEIKDVFIWAYWAKLLLRK